jgi:DNA topoisomerase-3
MEVAESLYNKGYLSYPRTETNRFNKSLNLKEIVGELKHNHCWHHFA